MVRPLGLDEYKMVPEGFGIWEYPEKTSQSSLGPQTT